jgi:hypothetical protein
MFSVFRMAALLIFMFPVLTMAATSYVKQWDAAVISGAIAKTNYQYYFEPQIRFIGDPYIFNQSLLLGGLGYQYSPSLILYAGPGWIINKSTNGDVTHEIRLWQQANLSLVNRATVTLNSRTRMEERMNTQYSSIAYRFRQRFWLRMPIRLSSKYSLSAFDEFFLDLNHPEWVSPYFFSQNRAFVGVGYQLSNNVLMDAGYLNQYLHANKNQVDHVLLVLFTINN